MSFKKFKEFNNNVSWNSKFYVLLVVCFMLFVWIFQDNSSTYAAPAMMAIVVVLLVDFGIRYFVEHPRIWMSVRWIIFLLVMLLVLIGAVVPVLG